MENIKSIKYYRNSLHGHLNTGGSPLPHFFISSVKEEDLKDIIIGYRKK